MPSLEDHSISCYAIDGQILVLVRAREEDCFVIYSSLVFRPVERSPWTVRSPITRFEVYSKCLRTASVVGKLAFQIEHFSRRRHSRNCNSRCGRKEKSVRASHSLLPNVSVAQLPPFEINFYIKCMVLKLLGGHFLRRTWSVTSKDYCKSISAIVSKYSGELSTSAFK